MALADEVEQALVPGGRLSRHWPGYELRGAQVALARDLADTIAHGGVLMAEAPTGIGKSVAYLLPAVLHARATGERVVVATATRSLQDQLAERDLPALLTALGVALPFACLKGKQNYLCPRALDLASGQGAEEDEILDDLRAWAAEDEGGDLDRFPADDPEAFRRVRGRVTADPAACTGITCRRGRECPWVRARRRAAEARVVIVNHALLARAAESDGLLPEPDVLIVDEAHRLEGVLAAQLERGVSRYRVEELLRLLGPLRGGRRAQGLLARVRSVALPLLVGDRERAVTDLEQLAERSEEARTDFEALFTRLAFTDGEAKGPYGRRARHRRMEDLFAKDLQVLEVALSHCSVFTDTLRRAAGTVLAAGAGEPGDTLAAELELVAARWSALGEDLAALADAADPDWVYWRSQASGAHTAELRGAPVWVGAHARRMLLSRPRAVVLTSATLASGEDFGWAAERLGLGEAAGGLAYHAVQHPSPFDLARQMRTLVLDAAGDEVTLVSDAVAALAHAARRNILVLLTAHERMRRVRERLARMLPEGMPLAAQDLDGPAGLLAERFRGARGAVLLGVQSLWEGVDFPGEALEVLVVAKLPFSVPDDPLVEARGERLREHGRDPFRHDAVPEAVVRFRQGVGRLIRRTDDRGVLVVCDPRLVTARYRRPFLAALPGDPEIHRDAAALAADAARFLSLAAPVPEETL